MIFSFKNSHFIYFYLSKNSTGFAQDFISNVENQAEKSISNSNISSLAINFNKNYFSIYTPDCSINSISDEELTHMSLVLEENYDEINELSNKLCNWLEKLDEGVWDKKYQFYVE